jgi:DNA repair exonuclease SbcCD ATPase subunit
LLFKIFLYRVEEENQKLRRQLKKDTEKLDKTLKKLKELEVFKEQHARSKNDSPSLNEENQSAIEERNRRLKDAEDIAYLVCFIFLCMCCLK